MPSECQTVLIRIRTDVSSVLIWVQTVCKGNQQTTLIDKRVKPEAVICYIDQTVKTCNLS